MLICVSANPAIDRRLRIRSLKKGCVNRALSATPYPGGKAVHVALAARALGEEVMWIGFLGGAAGEECERRLVELGIQVNVVRTESETRTNLEIVEDDGAITEILEPGGRVSDGDVERMLSLCRDVFAEYGAESQVALSGSLPPGSPTDLYAQMIRSAHAYGCRVLLDASGEALRRALGSAPDLVKPNSAEAESITGQPILEPRAAEEAARRLIAAGAHSAAISLGSAGLVWRNGSHLGALAAEPPLVEGRSAVGCGDATLAGFAVAYSRKLSDEETLRLAAACGTANCLAEAPGMIRPSDVERLVSEIPVRRVSALRQFEQV
jgi:1-phosphofructokinase family hexose kinase